MINIIFNSTRQWNCGDEFILFGVMNIFKHAGVKFNPKKDTLDKYVNLVKDKISFNKVDYDISKIEYPINTQSLNSLFEIIRFSNASFVQKICKNWYCLLSHILFGQSKKHFRNKYKQMKLIEENIVCDW